MSINSLANAAVARRLDTVPLGTVPQGLDEIAKAAATLPSTGQAPTAGSAASEKPASAVDTALNVLFGYIPTEILTLYVAVLAAIQPQTQNEVTPGQWNAFWSFLVATPIVVWFVYAAKVKALQKPLPLKFEEWPVWEMFAATIAYCAWALALPNTPFAEHDWYSPALSGVVVLVASTALGLIAPIFQHPLSR